MISPDATRGIRDAADRGAIKFQQRKYKNGDLQDSFLAIAATNDRVHVLQKGALLSVNLVSLEVTSDKRDWNAVQWMCSWGNQLYLFDGQAHYRVNPKTFESVEVSQVKPQ